MSSPLDQAEVLSGNDLSRIMQLWEEKQSTPGFDPVPILVRLAQLFEVEYEAFKMKDPDPFDERHPSRTDPNGEYGRLLKALFRKDVLMSRLVNDYLRDNFFTRQNVQQSSFALNVAACRLILAIMPGLDTAAVFQVEYDHLIKRLYSWAEFSPEPLQSYATGLLGAAMEVQEIAVSFREQNIRILPIILNRLHRLQQAHLLSVTHDKDRATPTADTPMDVQETANPRADSASKPASATLSSPASSSRSSSSSASLDERDLIIPSLANETGSSQPCLDVGMEVEVGPSSFRYPPPYQIEVDESEEIPLPPRMRGNMIPNHPVTSATSQKLILHYLTPMGEYQEFLPQVFEHNAMQLILRYIECIDPKDTCLAFEALKYLASLLCHKKFSLEFIANGGLERLLKIPRPTLASTGVSIAFYYLAYCEDAMERICQLPREIVTEMVSYALWLLGCQHDSGRCHATMFFGLSCQFKIILDEFDKQDGIRRLYNVIAVLPVLFISDQFPMNEDQEAAQRQVIRHVCVALKKYFENHLYYKYTQVTRQQEPSGTVSQPVFKAVKNSPEVISQQITTLQELLPMKAHWAPVDELLKLGGINLLLRIISLTFDWSYSGRGDTVRYALDALSVCTVISRVHNVFVETIDQLSVEGPATGISILLSAVDGDVADAEVQKSALALLVHLVCAPVHRPSGSLARFGSAKKRMPNKSSEELIQKVWESVRSNNGILVLLALMRIKVPITDADCIRGMACRALAGLARSETVRQIVGKLPLFVHGELQSLMRDPILQEKRYEHVQFQKYALELMERVSGKVDAFGNQLDTSLSDIHKANVVAQTRIQFHEHQLYQLIHQHLVASGLKETANTLLKETGLSPTMMQHSGHLSSQNPVSSISRSAASLHSPFVFRSPNTHIIQRSRVRSRTVDASFNATTAQANLQAALAAASIETPNNSMSAVPGTNGSGNSLSGQSAGNSNGNGTPEVACDGVDATMIDPAEPLAPIKLIKKHTGPNGSSQNGHQGTNGSVAPPADANRPSAPSTSQRSLQKQISATDATNFLLLATTSAKTLPTEPAAPTNNITLNSIITEYLTNQHALCKHPMSTCPPFDLFKPHKCPDPRPNRMAGLGNNFTARFYRRHTGYSSRRFDRRLVHSNFSVARVLRTPDLDYSFTSCDFTPCGTKLIVGSQAGEVKIFNLNDTTEEHSCSCHEAAVTSTKCSKDGSLLLTSAAWRFPMTALWTIEDNRLTQKLAWDEEDYAEFANIQSDKVLATTNELASIYDINTGQKVMKFEPAIGNHYTKNRATFCPTDELILSDGVLWDATSGKEIHKFDKLNQNISGVFHPNGLEIVENTEVWDLRTFHLLRTVPSLDQTHVQFSPQNVMYGLTLEREESELTEIAWYQTSFKVLDSYDYSSIATIDVKRNISDLAINRYGSQIAVVENQAMIQESVVRIYSVGRKRNVGDDQDEEEEEDDEEMENSDEHSMSETESAVFRNVRGENNGVQRRGRRRGRIVVPPVIRMRDLNDDDDSYHVDEDDDDDALLRTGSTSSNSDDEGDDDDDNDDEDDDGDGDNNNDDDDDHGGEDSDESSWTTTSDVEDYLFGFH